MISSALPLYLEKESTMSLMLADLLKYCTTKEPDGSLLMKSDAR